jgi:hypothetical protein
MFVPCDVARGAYALRCRTLFRCQEKKHFVVWPSSLALAMVINYC